MTDFNQACPCCYAGGISEERERELLALLRRDWAVRVLDACGVAWKNSVPAPIPVYNEPRWVVVLPMHVGSKYAATPDAVRHAAALAVFPTLDAETRAELEECP